MKKIVGLLVLTLSFSSFAQLGQNKSFKAGHQRDRLIGNIIKNALETYHFQDYKIDDSLSVKAFDEFIKKIDYGKQFLLQKDVESLGKYRKEMDDLMILKANGKYKKNDLIELTNRLLKQRIQYVDGVRKRTFKGKFKFSGNEELELDPEKRTFSTSEKELASLWNRTFKHQVLNRYLSLKEGQEN